MKNYKVLFGAAVKECPVVQNLQLGVANLKESFSQSTNLLLTIP